MRKSLTRTHLQPWSKLIDKPQSRDIDAQPSIEKSFIPGSLEESAARHTHVLVLLSLGKHLED
jgi:hypothetical protein